METIKKYLRILLNILLPIAAIVLVCLILPKFLGLFMPLIIAGIIAMIANPMVRFLENRLSIVRKHSSFMVIVLVLGIVFLGGYLLIAKLVTELVKFVKDLPQIYVLVSEELMASFAKFAHLFSRLPNDVQGIIESIATNLADYTSGVIQRIGEPTVLAAGNAAKGIPNLLIHFIFMILFTYFFVAYRDEMVKIFHKYFPMVWRERFDLLNDRIRMVIGGYLIAQAKIMVVVAAIVFVGFIILDINYAFLLALLIAVLDFLPVLGAGTMLIPWAVIKLLTSEYYLGIGLLGIYLITLLVRQLIQPKILGDSMGLNPFTTMLLFYLGYKIAGFSGMILAVPVGVLLIEIYKLGALDSLIKNIKLLIDEINGFRKGE